MSDWKLRVSQRELHRLHVVRLTLERRENVGRGALFSDGNSYHYYAVVTNRWEMEGEELLRWQRERCRSVEEVHDVVKNDLAGGVMPSNSRKGPCRPEPERTDLIVPSTLLRETYCW